MYNDITKYNSSLGKSQYTTSCQNNHQQEGVVHVKGKVYDLRSANRRHRNSTNPTSDGKTGSVGHDVQRRDVNDKDEEVDHNEAADNYEFIVRLLDDLPPRSLRGDAILPRKALEPSCCVLVYCVLCTSVLVY